MLRAQTTSVYLKKKKIDLKGKSACQVLRCLNSPSTLQTQQERKGSAQISAGRRGQREASLYPGFVIDRWRCDKGLGCLSGRMRQHRLALWGKD